MAFGFGLGLTRGGGAGGLIPTFNANLLNGSLPQGATFSRGTIGTLYNSSGLVAYAPSNIALQSQTFTVAPWGTNNCAHTANATTAPDGTLTGDSLVENSANSLHYTYQNSSLTAGTTMTVSFYAKANTRTRCMVRENTITGSYISFDLIAGSILTTNGSVTGTITSAGNGWYRCTMTQPIGTTGSTQYGIFLLPSTGSVFADATYLGDGVSGLYLWGYQLEQSPTATTYTPTTSAAVYGPRFDYDPGNVLQQNLFTQSTFASGWSFSANASFVGTGTAPDGTNTAQLFNDSTGASSTYVYQSANWVNGTVYTISVYLRPLTATAVSIKSFQQSGEAIFTVAGGVISNSSVTGICTAQSATAVGNGWYLLTATMTANATNANNIGFLDYNTGDIGNVFYIWGAQYNVGSTALPYLATTSTPQTVCAPKGLLIEEARTNSLLQSNTFTNAAWNQATNIVVSTATISSPDGTANAYTLTDNATNAAHCIFGTGASITAGTAYTVSVYANAGTLRYVSLRGEQTSVASNYPWITVDLQTGAINSNGLATSSSATPVGNGWYRITLTFTALSTIVGNLVIAASNVSTAPIVTNTLGNAYAGTTQTLYVYGAQLEAGAFPTSYIPTTSAAVTRAADVAQITSFPWFNATAGSFVAVFDAASITQTTSIIGSALSSGAAIMYSSIGDIKTFDGTTGAATTGSYAINTTAKGGLTYSASGRTVMLNGNLGGIGTVAGNLQTVTSIVLGSGFGANYLNGHLQSIQYFNYALTNTQLQALTYAQYILLENGNRILLENNSGDILLG